MITLPTGRTPGNQVEDFRCTSGARGWRSLVGGPDDGDRCRWSNALANERRTIHRPTPRERPMLKEEGER